jgi:hypothetical protein
VAPASRLLCETFNTCSLGSWVSKAENCSTLLELVVPFGTYRPCK